MTRAGGRGMTQSSSGERAAEERLRLQIEAYHASALAYAAVKIGLPEAMGEQARTAAEIAEHAVAYRHRTSPDFCEGSSPSGFAKSAAAVASRCPRLGRRSSLVRRRGCARSC